MSQAETWTIGRLLTWTTDYLKQHRSQSPRLDAEVLLAQARGCKRIELYTAFDQIADDATRTAFRELVSRRAKGEPVAYLVGKREFFSLSFRVTRDVLIPRPETETLVVRLIDLAKHFATNDQCPRIADVGTGSGIIAICAAKHLPEAKVMAIDSSEMALAVARQNAADHGAAGRIELIHSNLFDAVSQDSRFQVIASNPPYVSESELARLPPDVRDFEPRQALVAGPRGTEVIERLIVQAAERLVPGGWLLMEISPMIEGAVRELITKRGDYELGPTIKDHAGQPRVIQAKRH
jgi:release factor glutamine methyltransferase